MRVAALRPAPARHAAPLALLVALVTTLLMMLMVVTAGPAQAHDSLLTSDPEDGAVLETSPESITLTYSADVLEVSPLVRVTDEAGEQIAELTPSVDGATVTAELPEPLAAGEYTVQWRVVSSDGHPIEGTFAITVEQGPAAPSDGGGEDAAASDAGGTASEDATAEEGPSAEATSEPAAAEETEDGSGTSMPLLLGVLGVIVVGAGIAALVIMRRRD